MPSRQIPPAQSPTPPAPPNSSPTYSLVAAFSILSILVILYRKIIGRKRATATVPSDSRPLPHRFSYSVLRRSTHSFSLRLGQGGFGPVYSGSLDSIPPVPIAVKVMDSGSLQGEREFHNEIFFASKLQSPHLVPVLGFSSDHKRRRMLLVYELMQNGNLQDALLHAKRPPELMDWKRRFAVALDIARGLEYLHGLDPPVIHGDIKPSNILLDQHFSAKIGDFGLARLKSENQIALDVDDGGGLEAKKGGNGGGVGVEDCGSAVEETESVTTIEDLNVGVGLSPSPESVLPETVVAPVSLSASEGNFDKGSVDSGKEFVDVCGNRNGKGIKSVSGRDWWWKQEYGEAEVKKGFVMEWIGTEINKERPNSDWIGASSGTGATAKTEKKKKKKCRRRSEWWMTMDEENNSNKPKRRPAREWWKEEYCEELARKKKKKNKNKKQMGLSSDDNGDDGWPRDEVLYVERKKRGRSRSHGSRGSIDWWLDGLSGELWRARGNSHDSVASGEIAKSGGVSSTPSMRGTVCYVAPEYGGGEDISEKCDVYSYGVLLLVLISGRRPLQVMNTPISEFQRANLLSWARKLARAGKLLDLVDKSVQCLDREQALLCITIALICLQKKPGRRPSMKEVVGMLSGHLEPPQLPIELSPSTQSHFPYKSHKTIR